MVYYDDGFHELTSMFPFEFKIAWVEKPNFIKNFFTSLLNYYQNISFDKKFYDEFEFLFKILIPPTYLEISVISFISVGGFKKFLLH